MIEPLSDQASSEVDLSSDYDPSLDGDESIFRSVSTSVNEHVYEYGRYVVHCWRLYTKLTPTGAIIPFSRDGIPFPTTSKSMIEKLSSM